MRLLITGLNGTLGPHLARAACAGGAEVVGWDRAHVNPDDRHAVAAHLRQMRPDAIAHLGFGPEAWAGQLAAFATEHGASLLFTSTAMVFHHLPDGPHVATDPRNAQDDYGRYKIRCEDAVLAANPKAGIVRLGWQIEAPTAGALPAGNHMQAQLEQWLARDGHVAASTAWRPACSFLPDTVAALWACVQSPRPGTWHLDSNAESGHDFASIVEALAEAVALAAGRERWPIRRHADYVHDQRLAGGGGVVPPLAARLPLLDESGSARMA
jgi:dTDP-4-dehydrorhamnose reductase